MKKVEKKVEDNYLKKKRGLDLLGKILLILTLFQYLGYGASCLAGLPAKKDFFNFLIPTQSSFVRCLFSEYPKYQETPMLFGYRFHDRLYNVDYLSAEELEKRKVVIKDGLFYNFDGTQLLTTRHEGLNIFVMDAHGNIYLEPLEPRDYKLDPFNHSSFFRGGPVAAAGELALVKGKLKGLTNRSGHYMPNINSTEQFIRELKERGVHEFPKLKIVVGIGLRGNLIIHEYEVGEDGKLFSVENKQ